MAQVFGPYDATTPQTITLTYVTNDTTLVLLNQSDYLLTITITPGNFSFVIPARQIRTLPLPTQTNTAKLTYNSTLATPVATTPQQAIYLELWNTQLLSTNSFISALSGIQSMVATAIINDGQTAGTTLIESTPSGYISSNVLLTSDAKLKLGINPNQQYNIILDGTQGIIQALLLSSTAQATTYNVPSGTGNVTFYTLLMGSFQIYAAFASNYKNTSGTYIQIPLPQQPKNGFLFLTTDSPGYWLARAGTQITSYTVITALSTGDGTTGTSNYMHSYGIGWCSGPCDTLWVNNNNATAHNGLLLLFGC